MKRLTDLTDRALKRRARRELVNIWRRLDRGDPGYVIRVCSEGFRATLDEIARRGIEWPKWRESKCE
jgi:hypothetical protein